MNNRKPTLKKEEPVWITCDDRLWTLVVWLLCDEVVRHIFVTHCELPVIRF